MSGEAGRRKAVASRTGSRSTFRNDASSPPSGSPFGEEYFTSYGAHGPGGRKLDYARNWRDHTFSLPDILKRYKARYGKAPRTFFDIGAADGRLVGAALDRGLKARGIENSPYILARITDPRIKARVRRADALQAIREIPDGACDIVIECAAQYLPPRRLKAYLRQVARICAGITCLSVDARNYQGNRSGPHAGVRTFETATWWRKALFEAGFELCEDDYYFFKGAAGSK